MSITRHAETTCPVCKYRLNASGRFEGGAPPTAGDIALCMNCGTILIYNDGALNLRMATQSEIESLSPEEREPLQRYADIARRLNARGLPF